MSMLHLFRSGRSLDATHVAPHASDFGSILDQAPDALLAVGPDGRIVRCNAAASEMFGRPSEDLIGSALRSLIVRGDRDAFDDGVRDVRLRSPQRFDVRLKRGRGGTNTVAFAMSPLRAPGNTRDAGVVIVARDVTADREAIAELTRSESRYRHLFEAASDAIMTFDSLGRFTTVNGAAEQISGYTHE